ncbi:MAG: dienelactone hydrolase family protein [Nocardioides sp.]|uniref:dienelactone hydrolase family protein n=1 Tax=Nocardioides sp. TaxID=35761 RepID=UPI0039E28EB9
MAELITIQTPDGTAEAYLARPPAASASSAGVLFYMDAIGLRPRIEEMVEEIASWGYVVLAPNVFYRDGDIAAVGPAADLRVPENRAAFFASGASKRVAGLTPDRVAADVPAYLATLRRYAAGPIGTTGYCMGARLAVRTAGLFPDEVVAVGGFHGGGLATEDPESPHTKIAGTRAAYVLLHADNDGSMPPEQVAVLEEALVAAGVEHVNEIIPGAPHGYTMSDTSMWDAAANARHLSELRALFERTLRRVVR